MNPRDTPASGTPKATQYRAVLLDFDGPATRLLPPPLNAQLADAVRAAVPAGVVVPEAVSTTTDHLQVLRWAADEGQATLRAVEDAAVRGEIEAAGVSTVTDGAREFLQQCADHGTPVVIVSNNAAEAITEFLHAHDLAEYVSHVVGRPYGHPEQMKPETAILDQALSHVGAEASRCVLVGDSVSDIVVAKRVGTASVGLAKSDQRADELKRANAGTVVGKVRELLIASNRETPPVSNPGRI